MKLTSTALALISIVAFTLPSQASVLIDEDFSSSTLPSGWTISVTKDALYNYALSGGINFTDEFPVTGESTSIKPALHNQRAVVSFLYRLPESVGDFEASMTFTWDQSIGRPENGISTPNTSTGTLYLSLYNGASSVIRAGLHDNTRDAGPAFYSAVNGDVETTALSSVAYSSLGQNTITVKRVNDISLIEWRDHTGNVVFSREEASTDPVDRIYLQFSMLRLDTGGVGTTKLGAITVHQVQFEAIPEPATSALLLGMAGIIVLRIKSRKGKQGCLL